MGKNKNELTVQGITQIDEAALFERVSSIIENRKILAQARVNREITLMYWEGGKYIQNDALCKSF